MATKGPKYAVIHEFCTKSNSQLITVKKRDNTSDELGMQRN